MSSIKTNNIISNYGYGKHIVNKKYKAIVVYNNHKPQCLSPNCVLDISDSKKPLLFYNIDELKEYLNNAK